MMSATGPKIARGVTVEHWCATGNDRPAVHATSPELVKRAMRVRNRLPYYQQYPYEGQQAFYAALCDATAFEALPGDYQQAILDAEAELDRERVHGPTRIACWIGLAVVGPLFVAVAAYAVVMLVAAAWSESFVPADALVPSNDDVLPLGFFAGVLVGAGLAKAWKALYYRLWPEREDV
jgi:hypothetical protein